MRLSDVASTRDASVEDLVADLVIARAALRDQEAKCYYLERSIIEAMEQRGATVVKTQQVDAKLVTPVTYDYGKLAALREITSADDLVGYTPAQDVTISRGERWNMTQAKSLARLSADHAAIIESARIPGASGIKLDRKPVIRGRGYNR